MLIEIFSILTNANFQKNVDKRAKMSIIVYRGVEKDPKNLIQKGCFTMTIKFTYEDFRVLDKILKRCETFADRRVAELGCLGIEDDLNYLKACELMAQAQTEGVDHKTYFEIVNLVDKVDTRWGW
jgi:hypothetical protein